MSKSNDDADLVARLRSSHAETRRDAEHELFERHRTSVDTLMRRMLGSDTDDCVQEAFVDIFNGIASFEGNAKLSTWIYRIALRRAWKCLAQRRRRSRGFDDRSELAERAPDPSAESDVGAELEAAELARRFAAALERLDVDPRTVIALSAIEGLGPAEIAEVLGVPVGTVHSRLARARARLRELLET